MLLTHDRARSDRAHRACSALVAALVVAAAIAAFMPSDASALGRVYTDRADDFGGPQIHVLYVIPRDAVHRDVDKDGTIANSIASAQTWLRGQTGGRSLRVDTFGGELDVTYVWLPRYDSMLAPSGATTQLADALTARGFDRPDKKYLVYYEGGANGGACGRAATPGRYAVLYLKGLPTSRAPCVNNPFAALGAAPGYWEYGLVHEVIHMLGFVPACAPHQTVSGGHVSDNPQDVMYAGSQPWTPALLDPGHDDYYGHTRDSTCPDLANSNYLTSNTPAMITVPDVRELSSTQAVSILIGARLDPETTGDDGPGAWVYRQTPVAGTRVAPGTVVRLQLRTDPTG